MVRRIAGTLFNILFILGLSALVRSLVVCQQVLRSEVAIMIGVSILLRVLALDGISRAEGHPGRRRFSLLSIASLRAYGMGVCPLPDFDGRSEH